MKSFSDEYEPTPDVGILIMRGLQHALYAAQVREVSSQSFKRETSLPWQSWSARCTS